MPSPFSGLDHDVLAPVARELADSTWSHGRSLSRTGYGKFGLVANPPGVSKWSGVEAYYTLHGIESQEVAAVGDGFDDLEMLRHAGVGIGVRGRRDEDGRNGRFLD